MRSIRRLGIGRTQAGAIIAQLNTLLLTANTVAENVASGTTVGTITNNQTGSTYSLIDNAGGRFALSGMNVNAATLTDVAADTAYNITVRETNAGFPNSPRDSVISITVTAFVPAVTLSALTLSDAAFVTGTAESGAINGATSGSTITSSGLPAGFTINSAARTWAWDGTGSVSTGNLTLIETLAGASNSPRNSVIGFEITSPVVSGEPTTANFALWEPFTIALTSGPTSYPITMSVAGPPEALETDNIHLNVRTSPGGVSVLDVHTPYGTGPHVFAGLDDIVSGTHTLRQRMERGDFFGDWSNVLEHGPDAVAPVLTLPTSAATGATTGSIGVTTDEANGTLYYVVTASATQPSAAQIKAGQSHLGASATFAGSQAVTTTGVKSATATGLAASTAYYAHFMHEDALANQSNQVVSASFTTLAAASAETAVTDARSVAAGYIGGYYEWNNIAVGTASGDRYVYAFVWAGESATYEDVQFNGVSGTKLDQVITGNICVYRSAGPITTGTTCTIGVKQVGNTNQIVLVAGISKGLPTVVSTAKTIIEFRNEGSHELSVVTPADGKSLVFGYVEAPTANGTWTNATFGAGATFGVTRLEGASKDAGTAVVETSGWGNKTSALIAINLGP